MLYRLFMLV
uniref:Uncharacterized protein n=1 Tax=Arundo donax TaxID=35708 RepID=A0A0A9BAR9_ARUDO